MILVQSAPRAARTVLWAAGVAASPAAKWLAADADGAGRIRVGPDFSVKGVPDVFAIGDTAAINNWNGQPVPGLAPAAKQAGTYIGRLIRAKIEGRSAPVPGLSHVSSGIRLITGHSAITEASFRSSLTR